MSNSTLSSFHEFSAPNIQGEQQNFSQYKGQVVLVVNVASKCGFTPQYKGLEEIFQEFKNQKFTVIGFPCNQFGFQEPGSSDEIQSFCSMTYNVTFPIMQKVDVNGQNSTPVYQFLKEKAPGLLGTEAIKWNFTKFLVGKNGEVLKRYAPNVEPKEIIPDIKKALAT